MARIKQSTIATRVALYGLPPSGGDFFPISLGYIAASLQARGVNTAIVEVETVNKNTAQYVTKFIKQFKPTLVGFSVYQANIKLALQLARLIKNINSNIIIVFGGPQITFMPKEAIHEMPPVDILMRGEGEVVWPDLVEAVEKESDPRKIPGIVFLYNNKIIETKVFELTKNLDDFPSPYQEIFDLSAHSIALMLSSRGCTFNCAFCYTPRAFQRQVRTHSVKRVISDMAVCVKNKIKRFYFADPAFTFDKKRTTQIMNEIIKRKWKIDIWCETRDDLVDEALLKLMAKGGVKYIAYGLESADKAVNKILRKKIDLENFKRVIGLTRKAGITPEVFTLYGLPGQTKESSLKTIKFLNDLKIGLTGNSAGQQLNLFFGTDINDNPQKYGLNVNKQFPKYLSPGVEYITPHINRKEIAQVARKYMIQ